jgi:hypothetical protein
MEKLATLIDPGNMSFAMNWDSADSTHAFATGLWNLLINLTERNQKTVFPGSNGTLDYSGYITGHGFDLPVDNVIQINVEVAINGAITGAIP